MAVVHDIIVSKDLQNVSVVVIPMINDELMVDIWLIAVVWLTMATE